MINIISLGKELGFEDIKDISRLKSLIEKAIYKSTSCGASIQFIDPAQSSIDQYDGEIVELGNDGGVVIGSIVEGVDGDGTEYHTLMFPFTMDEFQTVIDAVEEEAKEIWDATHGCDSCWEGCEDCNEKELGMYIPINSNCKSCKGHGVII